MNAGPNLTLDDVQTPTLLEQGGAEPDAPHGTWRIVLTVLVAVALPLEVAWFAKRNDPWAEARRTVAELDDAGRAALAADWERYRNLNDDEQRRLHELHEAVEADADPASLRAALGDYEKWKSSLSPVQSAQLVGLSPTERIERIRSLAAEQTAVASKALSPSDVKMLMAWLETQVDQHQEKLLAALPMQARQRLDTLGRRERNVALILAVLNFRGAAGPRLEYVTPAALAELKMKLSPGALRVWESAASLDERKQLLVEWIRQAAAKTYGVREGMPFAQRVDETELMRYFESELSETERARLETLPREEMLMQLKREYLRRRGLWKDPPGEMPQKIRPPGGKPPTMPYEKRPGLPPGDRSKGSRPGDF